MRTLICLSLLIGFSMLPMQLAALEAAFVGDTWDGKTVPAGAQCGKFGGTAPSPAITVSAIPAAANALVLEFSDRSYTPMDNGGHGKVGYRLEAGSETVVVPPIPPHTTDLPAAFWTVAEHGAPGWDKAGAYLPPCSGGKGNSYYVTIKAVQTEGDTLTEIEHTVLEMGVF